MRSRLEDACQGIYTSKYLVVLPALYFFFLAAASAALVSPSCPPYIPADEPGPYNIIPGGESGRQLVTLYQCGSGLLVIP